MRLHENSRAILWIAFFVCVMVAAFVLLRVVQSFYPTAAFLVPVADIAPFTTLNANQFTEILLPEAAVGAFPDALRPEDDVTGKVSRAALPKGMLVTKRVLGEQGDGSLATLLPTDPTSRVLSFGMNKTLAVGGNLQPGEKIDLYLWYGGVLYLVAPELPVLTAAVSERDDSVMELTVEVSTAQVSRVTWAVAEAQSGSTLIAVVPGADATTALNIPFSQRNIEQSASKPLDAPAEGDTGATAAGDENGTAGSLTPQP